MRKSSNFLFLQGAPRTGKSTILRNTLLPHETAVAGLMAQRLSEDGWPCGFRVCTVGENSLPALETNYTGNMSGVFLHHGKANLNILEDAIVHAGTLCEKDSCKLIILDEIGGIELVSATFMKSLDGILSLGKPCIGVIKSPNNLANTVDRLNLSGARDILRKNKVLCNRLKADGRVLDVDSDNLDATAKTVGAFLARFISHSR